MTTSAAYDKIVQRIQRATTDFKDDFDWLEPCLEEMFGHPDLTNKERNYLSGYLEGRKQGIYNKPIGVLAVDIAQDFDNTHMMIALITMLWTLERVCDQDTLNIHIALEGLEGRDALRMSECNFLKGFGDAVPQTPKYRP